jgi:hypothetical protein
MQTKNPFNAFMIMFGCKSYLKPYIEKAHKKLKLFKYKISSKGFEKGFPSNTQIKTIQ